MAFRKYVLLLHIIEQEFYKVKGQFFRFLSHKQLAKCGKWLKAHFKDEIHAS